MVTKVLASLYRRWGVRSLGAKLLIPSIALMLLSFAGTSFFFLKGTGVTRARLLEQEAARELDYVVGKLTEREDAIAYAGSLLARDPEVAKAIGQDTEVAISTLNAHAVLVRDRFDLGLVQIYDADAVARASLVLSSASSTATSTRSLLDLAESGAAVARVIDDRLLLLRRFPVSQDGGTVVVGIDLETELARIRAQGRLTSDLKLSVRDHTVSASGEGASLAAGVSGFRTASVPDHHVTVEALGLGSTAAELILERHKGDIEVATRNGVIVSLGGCSLPRCC